MFTVRECQELVRVASKEGIARLVVGAFIYHNSTLLLLKRASTEKFLPDLVELPSGKVDTGENLLTALAREVKEETNLDVLHVNEHINSFDYTSGSGKKCRQFNFTVDVKPVGDVKLNPKEHQAHYWVKEAEVKSYNISDSVKDCIAGFFAEQKKVAASDTTISTLGHQ